MEIDRAIKKLEARLQCIERETSGTDSQCNRQNCDECDLCYAQGTTGEQIEVLGYVVATLKQKEWLIDQYEQKAESLEQDINDAASGNSPMGVNDFVRIAKLDVYRRVLRDLKAEQGW